MHERTKDRRVMLGGLSISAEDFEVLARYRDGAEERRDGSPNDVLIGHSLEERFVLVVVVRLMNPFTPVRRGRVAKIADHIAAAFDGLGIVVAVVISPEWPFPRSEEHKSELQSLMRISYAVFCLKKKQVETQQHDRSNEQ